MILFLLVISFIGGGLPIANAPRLLALSAAARRVHQNVRIMTMCHGSFFYWSFHTLYFVGFP